MHKHQPRANSLFLRFLSFLFSPIDTFKCSWNGMGLCYNCGIRLIVPYELESLWIKLLYIIPATVSAIQTAMNFTWFGMTFIEFLLFHHLITSIMLAIFPWTDFREDKDNAAYIAGEFRRDFWYKLILFGVIWYIVFRIAHPIFS